MYFSGTRFGLESSLNHIADIGKSARISNRKLRTSQMQTAETPFSFPINPYLTCARNSSYQDGDNWELVVVVISALSHFIRRNAIRNTWGSIGSSLNTKVVFLVGEDPTGRMQSHIEKESDLFGDVIQVELRDSYDNLTYKSIAMLQWIHDYCENSNFYMKADDDVYANLENILNRLNTTSLTNQRFLLCHVFKDAPPNRNIHSKWFTSYEEYSSEYFPTYCSGTAYAFSAPILSDLYQSSKYFKLLRMEDVYITGVAAKGQDITHIHDGGFSFVKREPSGCAFNETLTGHEMTVKQMFIIFAQLQSKEIDCVTGVNKYLERVENMD